MSSGEYERSLVRTLTATGRPAMRCPTSGAGTARDLPDVLCGRAMKDGEHFTGRPVSFVWAVELKTTSETTAYWSQPSKNPDEVADLRRFSAAFGATPWLAVKFKKRGTRNPYWLVAPEAARRTDAGTYAVSASGVEERAAWKAYPATENKEAVVERVDNGT